MIHLALNNYGVCTRKQLLEHGLSGAAIDRRVRSRMLTRVASGIYLLPGFVGLESKLAAATAGAKLGLASHLSALFLHGFPVTVNTPEIVVPKDCRTQTSIAIVHESRYLPARDRVMIRGIPACSVGRALCDSIPQVGHKRATFLTDHALSNRLVSAPSLITCHLALCKRGRAGTVARRVFLDAKLGEAGVSESRLESLTYELLVRYGITGFSQQFLPPWYDGRSGRTDFAFVSEKVILETDGRSWHSSEQAMASDRRRDRLAIANGWVVIRYTWHEITQRPEEVAAEISALLKRRSPASDEPELDHLPK